MTDEPIDEQDYVYGVKVVDIGAMRVARGKTRRPVGKCRHLNLSYDNQERRIHCNDCESDIDAFDAFEGLVRFWDSAEKTLRGKVRKADEAIEHNLRRIAAKNLDKEWSKRNTIPTCPHCDAGLMPDDFKVIRSLTSKPIEVARRKRNNGN